MKHRIRVLSRTLTPAGWAVVLGVVGAAAMWPANHATAMIFAVAVVGLTVTHVIEARRRAR